MSRIINIVLLLIFTTQFSNACDVCGCGVGTSSFGIMPNIQGHFIGLKAQYGRFQSEHPPLFSDSKPMYGDESIYNLSLWSRVAVSQRLHLYIDLPYQSIYSTENGVTSVYSGIGDIGLMVNYFVFNRSDPDKYDVLQTLQVGSGIKLPTGRKSIAESDGYILRSVQPGIGAYAVPLNAMYTIRKGNIGMHAELNYQHYFRDDSDYQFGDRFQQSLGMFMQFAKGQTMMLPSIGLNYSHATGDHDGQYRVEPSGGNTVSASLGYQVFRESFSIGIQGLIPMWQNNIGGYVKSKPQLQASILFNF